jgi:catalase
MHQKALSRCAVAGLFALAATPSFAADPVTAPQVVEAIEGTFGVTKGERRNHIKGTCAAGEFVGAAGAGQLSSSAMFSGKPVPVVARFSLAGGNPKIPDTAGNPRGMALEFRLPGNQLQHITMLNTPVFGAASAETFLALTLATRPDPATGRPDPEKVKAFRAAHPDNAAQTAFLAANNPPRSYGSSSYFGIHTFKFSNAQKKVTLVRWQFVPKDGEARLTADELKAAGANFLEQALVERTRKGPLQWDMVVSIGEPGDSEDNPTVQWPDTRRKVTVGTLSITAAMAQKGAECEKVNFDPLVMADGIAPTNDPVLLFRSPAYAVSFAKRLGGQ